METFAIEQLATKFELSSLNLKRLSGSVLESKTSLSRKIVRFLKTDMQRRKKTNFTSVFAITAPGLLLWVGTDQVHQVLQTLTAVQICAASGEQRQDCLLWVLLKKTFLPTVLSVSMFPRSSLTKKKTWAKMALPQSVPTTTKVFLLHHRAAHATECMDE